jgi:hypothetical protein
MRALNGPMARTPRGSPTSPLPTDRHPGGRNVWGCSWDVRDSHR